MIKSYLRKQQETMVCFCGCILPTVLLKVAARAKNTLSLESRYLLEISPMDQDNGKICKTILEIRHINFVRWDPCFILTWTLI